MAIAVHSSSFHFSVYSVPYVYTEQNTQYRALLAISQSTPDFAAGKDYQLGTAVVRLGLAGIESSAGTNFMMICNTGDFALSSNNWYNPRQRLAPSHMAARDDDDSGDGDGDGDAQVWNQCFFHFHPATLQIVILLYVYQSKALLSLVKLYGQFVFCRFWQIHTFSTRSNPGLHALVLWQGDT